MTTGDIEFGLCLPQFSADGGATVRAAKAAEADGYAAVSLFDHLRPLGGPPQRPILECLTMLTAVAAATSSVRVLPLVLRAPLRPPPVVGAVLRTLDLLAPDRVVCGVGGGDRQNAAEDLSVGLPALPVQARHDAIRAVVAAVREQAPGVPIWIGGTSAALRTMAGQIGDGWNVWGAQPGVVAAAAAQVQAAALASGRPAARITWGGQVVLAPTNAKAAQNLALWGAGRSQAELVGVISGDAAAVGQQLNALVDAGVQTIMVSFVGLSAAVARRAFAHDVLPGVHRRRAS